MKGTKCLATARQTESRSNVQKEAELNSRRGGFVPHSSKDGKVEKAVRDKSQVEERGDSQPVYPWQAAVRGWTGGFQSPRTHSGRHPEEEAGAEAGEGCLSRLGAVTVADHRP